MFNISILLLNSPKLKMFKTQMLVVLEQKFPGKKNFFDMLTFTVGSFPLALLQQTDQRRDY